MTRATALMVVGGGKMGEALVAGLVHTGWARADAIVVVETDGARRAELAARHPSLRVVGAIATMPRDRGAAGWCRRRRQTGRRRRGVPGPLVYWWDAARALRGGRRQPGLAGVLAG